MLSITDNEDTAMYCFDADIGLYHFQFKLKIRNRFLLTLYILFCSISFYKYAEAYTTLNDKAAKDALKVSIVKKSNLNASNAKKCIQTILERVNSTGNENAAMETLDVSFIKIKNRIFVVQYSNNS